MESRLYERALPARGGYRDLAPEAAYAARERVRLVDVREPHEWHGELGHVPGAELVPLSRLGEAAATWDREAEIILICRSGGRSARAAEALVASGFRRVMNLAGGMLAYNMCGLPVARA